MASYKEWNESGEELVARVRDQDYYEMAVPAGESLLEAYRDHVAGGFAVLRTTAWVATFVGRIVEDDGAYTGTLHVLRDDRFVDDGVSGVLRAMAEALVYADEHPEPEID